jgi:PhoH-like ATPase
MGKKKIFVLDTNVPLHNSNCLFTFEENDIVIPIGIFDEMDTFKKGSDTINYNAREFIRFLDGLPEDEMFNGGASLGDNLGKIRVIKKKSFADEVRESFADDTVDNEIINTAYCLKNENRDQDVQVVIISNDANLRIKAKSLKLRAENYETDAVSDYNSLYKDVRTISVNDEVIDSLYKSGQTQFACGENFYENEFVILEAIGKKTALASYRENNFHLIKKDGVYSFGIKPKNSEQAFALYALLNPGISLITIVGKAGTGKTIIALAAGLQQVMDDKNIKLFFTRQTIPLGNREQGFLPGNVDEKINPFMQALYDNLAVIKEVTNYGDKVNKYQEEKRIFIQPLSYLRGRSLVNTFFIVDEAQNLTPQESKAIITRAGEGTKIILIGDITQIDHPFLDKRSNGLSHVIEKMRGLDIFANVILKKGERSFLAELAGNRL